MLRESTKKDWGKYWVSSGHQPQVIHKELLDHLFKVIPIKNKNILEIGAGMGGDSLYLAKSGAIVTVLDFSPEALARIKETAKKENINLKTILADAKKMPFKKGAFDIVFHQGFLEHFSDPIPVLKEQKRVLKNRGILVVDVPQRYTTYTLKKHLAIWRGKWFAGWEKEYSINELEKLVKIAGFQVIRSYGWGYYGKMHQLRYLKLGRWYELLWQNIETSRIHFYLNFCIGVIASKI